MVWVGDARGFGFYRCPICMVRYEEGEMPPPTWHRLLHNWKVHDGLAN